MTKGQAIELVQDRKSVLLSMLYRNLIDSTKEVIDDLNGYTAALLDAGLISWEEKVELINSIVEEMMK